MKGPLTQGVPRRLSRPHLENYFGVGDELIGASHHATNELTQEVLDELVCSWQHSANSAKCHVRNPGILKALAKEHVLGQITARCRKSSIHCC